MLLRCDFKVLHGAERCEDQSSGSPPTETFAHAHVYEGACGERAATTYEIVVRGDVGDSLAEDLSALGLEHGRAIVVEIIDQSHRHGVLERLRDLNIEIERVNPL